MVFDLDKVNPFLYTFLSPFSLIEGLCHILQRDFSII